MDSGQDDDAEARPTALSRDSEATHSSLGQPSGTPSSFHSFHSLHWPSQLSHTSEPLISDTEFPLAHPQHTMLRPLSL